MKGFDDVLDFIIGLLLVLVFVIACLCMVRVEFDTL